MDQIQEVCDNNDVNMCMTSIFGDWSIHKTLLVVYWFIKSLADK